MTSSSCHSSASGELWGFPMMPSNISVDVLLPNGIFICVDAARESSLIDLKREVWSLAKDLPLFDILMERSVYVFVGVTKDATIEEFYDEQRRLCDIHLFQPVLQLAEAKGNRDEKILNRTITQVIGIPIDDFSQTKNPEVEEFRKNISFMCKNLVEKRNRNENPHAIISHLYPPRLESSAQLSLHSSENHVSKNTIVIRVWIVQENSSLQTHASVKVAFNATPVAIIKEVMKKKCFTLVTQNAVVPSQTHTQYILKICGINEYLVGDFPICQYKYIRQCVNRDKLPDLMLQSTEDVLKTTPPFAPYIEPKISKYKSELNLKIPKSIPSFAVSSYFKLRVNSGSYLNVVENLYVLANVYHGTKPLCFAQRTGDLAGSTAPKWDHWLNFNISICNIPWGAKVCLSVCGVRRKKDEPCALAWANVPLYDFRGYLLQGKYNVHLWHPPCHMEGFFHPIGMSGSNPCKETPCLELEFESFGSNIQFVKESSSAIDSGDYVESGMFTTFNGNNRNQPTNEDEFETVSKIIYPVVKLDPLSPLSDGKKQMLWNNRKHCMKIPESLPKLLQSVQWENRDCVQEMYQMLNTWKYLNPEIALELLDSKYPDPVVRQFATTCLEKGLTDDGLFKYLLQLVTALKFEAYLDSSLVRLLLSKAITNLRIGHFLFWHLKSEIHDVQVSFRFGLILEAYCRTCGAYLDQLLRQTEIVEKLINVHTILQKEDALSQKTLRDYLLKPDYVELLKNNTSPLNPACRLGTLEDRMCEVKASAKRPLLLQWHNADPLSNQFQPFHGILFKNGDDLRQDMLTLQILRVMDDIWQNDGLDLFISPYICISMGQNVGMIELVQSAETVMTIQKKGGVVRSLQLKNGTLHQWLKDNNVEEKQYQKAISNFTRSCAGYSVATLVLGIVDRHNDNIMIKKNGQMFHIDFGHFLNHKKKKYGICRNRVPFVLPGDFIRVICHGTTSDFGKSADYKNFEDLCCQAYMSIRKKAGVIINLLCMMLGAGLPELSSFEDIEYVRSSLAVEKSTEDALQYFKACMAVAQNKQWTTKVDWVCHAVRQSVRK